MIFGVIIISLHAQLTDSIIDSRDGQRYKIVKIGEQWWMQENLNIGNRISSSLISADNGIIEKYCYNNNETNCDTYGGLYQWNEMMDYHPSDNGKPGTICGICPAGWHVPTDEEWKELEMYLGMTQAEADLVNTWRGTGVGTALRAGGSSGYEALYAGKCSSGGYFSLLGFYEYIWTSTDYGSNAYRRCLSKDSTNSGRWNTFPKTYAFSVRCVKDICLIENISLEVRHVNCYGGSDGEIDATAEGSGTYKYQWSTGDTIEDLTGLQAGYYKVTATDSLGCNVEGDVVLTEPDPIHITADYTPRISIDSINGYIDLDVGGGTAPYNFVWSNGSTSQKLTDLDTGNYSVKVTDNHGCIDSASFTIEELTNLNDIAEIQVIVHPNPFNGTTNIYFKNPEGARYQLSIIDLTGKIVRTVYNITTDRIILNRDNLQAGLYLIELRGSQFYRGKMVVE